jgi:hypothetical protein
MGRGSFRAVAVIWSFCVFVPYFVGLKTGLYKGLAVSIISLMPLVLLVALLFARAGNAWLRYGLAAALLAVTLASELRARSAMNHDPRSDREWVRRIIGRSHPGDAVVCCTGNFYPLVDYYLRNDPKGAQLRLFDFPEDLKRHPGWFNEPMVLRDRAGVEREAQALAAELAATAGAGPGRKVWVMVVKRLHPITAQILTGAIGQRMTEVERIDVSGNYALFDQIVAFVARPDPDAAGGTDAAGAASRAAPGF